MSLMFRGIFWYGLYSFLILLPLLTAVIVEPDRAPQPLLVELAVGAGFVGLAVMAFEFALIARIEKAAEPFGEDSLQLFHNLMGTVALGLILAHPLLLIISGYPAACWLNPFAGCANLATRTAAIALSALILLVVTSVWRRRLRIRYEVWYLMHGTLALVILAGAMVHILILGRYTTTPAVRAVWLLYGLLVVGLVVWQKLVTPIRNWQRRWEVVENRVERGNARTLTLKPCGHDGFDFMAGQFSWLKLGRTPFGLGQHPISISSAADVEVGGTIGFTIKGLGDWSSGQVPALKPGDRIWVDGPYGVFTIDRKQAMGYVLVGGGVGITPLHSMCQTMAKRQDPRPVVLFYGASDEDDLTLIGELEDLTGRMNLTLVPVLSRPSPEWRGEKGYIDVDIMRRHVPEQVQWFKFLICGPKPLMDTMDEAIPGMGIDPANVLTERFDMS